MPTTNEHTRLEQDGRTWKRWGPYLSERAWGTVREDYSSDGTAWKYFPHDHARSRAYRWNEDGLAGICDDQQHLCFALALWNERDPILKERLFGLDGPEGNHGEDVKEYYFYLDSTPTHSYMEMLYKYPQAAYPYADLVDTNGRRSRTEPEYELIDTGVFAHNRYFDVFVAYAKADPDDILIRILVSNRGPDAAPLHLLPTLWFRNTWSWGRVPQPGFVKPLLRASYEHQAAPAVILAEHHQLGRYALLCDQSQGAGRSAPTLLFTENETNLQRLCSQPNPTPYVKDSINDTLVLGKSGLLNPEQVGTKAAAHYQVSIPAGATVTVRLRLTAATATPPSFADFDAIFAQRQSEANAFYAAIQPATLTEDERRIQRQAYAGMLWSKQFYHYDVAEWMSQDKGKPLPPGRRWGRNAQWTHLYAADIISMPDKWEYPWFAAWDLAFHCIPLAMLDIEFAKQQLMLMGREWYQHPNGQFPAYEWQFGDVNPPVLVWAAMRIYRIEEQQRGKGDRAFLEYMYQKLAENFTWWVNRKDKGDNNLFEGGFLGLDNIGVFDRSAPLPTGGYIEQSDGTSWMGMFCIYMMAIALELSHENPVYDAVLSKYAYHFMYMATAMDAMAGGELSLWDTQDQFYYDVLRLPDWHSIPFKIRSMVGLTPLFAVLTFEHAHEEFAQRVDWFVQQRPQLAPVLARMRKLGVEGRRMLALCRSERLAPILRRMLDEQEFLSPYGIRALSRCHKDHPYTFDVGGTTHTVAYLPAESDSGIFGGNSNWRGPIWMPVNYLLIESLRCYHQYYGDSLKVECPTGSGRLLNLAQVADELAHRLLRIFTRDEHGRRAVFGDVDYFQHDPHWRDYLPFYEYFHGDNGRGIGASHQTGWTGLVATLLQELGEKRG